jgi:hypothetical protein
MAAVCVLLLASHVAHLWWVVRPDAPVAVPPPWLDAAVLATTGAALAVVLAARRRQAGDAAR